MSKTSWSEIVSMSIPKHEPTVVSSSSKVFFSQSNNNKQFNNKKSMNITKEINKTDQKKSALKNFTTVNHQLSNSTSKINSNSSLIIPKSDSVNCVERKFYSVNVTNNQNNNVESDNKSNEVKYNKINKDDKLYSLKQEWKKEQFELKKKLITFDKLTFDPNNLNETLKYIGGVDISFDKQNPKKAIASFVVLSFPDLKVIYEDYNECIMNHPYIAGFLAFREVPHLEGMIKKLKEKQPTIFPQVILVDGNGILHQRGFGLACHLGVLLNVPTIGVAKKFLVIDGMTDDQINEIKENHLKEQHASFPLIGKSGKTHGMIYHSSSKKENFQPLFISLGHCISLETSMKIVKNCCKLYKNPEPIRQADLRSRKLIEKLANKKK
ncbi:hypothetical protein ABK040_011348 [Willaertia magna]